MEVPQVCQFLLREYPHVSTAVYQNASDSDLHVLRSPRETRRPLRLGQSKYTTSLMLISKTPWFVDKRWFAGIPNSRSKKRKETPYPLNRLKRDRYQCVEAIMGFYFLCSMVLSQFYARQHANPTPNHAQPTPVLPHKHHIMLGLDIIHLTTVQGQMVSFQKLHSRQEKIQDLYMANPKYQLMPSA